MGIEDLAQYGVAIFSIGALVYTVVYVVNRFLDFMKNHLAHHTEIDDKLASAVRELLEFLKYQNKNKF